MSWRVRKAFWDGLAVFKFRVNKPVVVPVPRADGRRLEAVSLASQFPDIPIANIRVADAVPELFNVPPVIVAATSNPPPAFRVIVITNV